MLEEDLDDTHLCIKCSATIVGLDNYVQHRKTNCGGKTPRTPIVPGYGGFEYPDSSGYGKSEATERKTTKTLSDPYDLPDELGADVFFSSLQLQSVQASSGGKTSSSQQMLTRKATATILSAGREETEGDWQEESTNNSDNLMKVVRDISESKKFEPIFKPIAFTHGSPEPEQSDDDDDDDEDFEDDDDDDEDYIPMPYSGGKWKPGSQPAPKSGGKWKRKSDSTLPIPPSHARGKWNPKANKSTPHRWKPSQAQTAGKTTPEPTTSDDLLSQIRAKLKSNNEYIPKERIVSPVVPESGGKWKPGFSKPFTSRKWKSHDVQNSPEVLEAQTGGKWKPDAKWKTTGGQEYPGVSLSQTGGKWKTFNPQESLNVSEPPQIEGKWKPGGSKTLKLLVLPTSIGSKWKAGEGNESPEALETHVSGKWKPGQQPTDCKETVQPSWEEQESWPEAGDSHPPFEHTKGKWVPGTKVERLEYKEEALPPPQDFWCNICCRKLKTKAIYEKHLKSGVHVKKSETEQQLARVAVENLELSKQLIRPPEILIERAVSPEAVPGKRKRRKTFIRCEVCKHRMQKYLVGKHLISHYHYVRMALNREKSFGMVLDHIHQIVLQSPFQCTPCRFYANTEENFLDHWNSVEHRDKTERPGKFWCSFCRFECEDNNQMRRHLLGVDHREVILAINRSVPICISKKVSIECPKCHQGFRYNMELRQHAQRCDSAKEAPKGTASDEYQSRFRCKLCPDEVLKSKTALQRHEKLKHNKRHYFCSVCDVEFENPLKAIKHRKSTLHRKNSAEKLRKSKREAKAKSKNEAQCEKCEHVSSSDVEAMLHQLSHSEKKNFETQQPHSKLSKEENTHRKCPYCKDIFKTKLDLKAHLTVSHPESKHICPLCGEAFTLPQELGSHRRYKICIASTSQQPGPSASPPKEEETTSKKSWKCSDCSFESAYESELIFHRIIHTQGLEALQSDDKKLNCPICEKSFAKHSLRHHLRQHTNEKIFTCGICNRSFSRRHNYKEHMQYLHAVGGVKKRKPSPATDESFICDTCGKIFRTKYSLKLHINIHTERDKKYRCPVEECQYVGRNRSALNMHRNTHGVKMEFQCKEEGCKYQGKSAYHLKRHMKNHLKPEKVYKCPECDFQAKIPGHIRRHVRIHTGECPYKCPHCDYSCGYIENLRKHILTTKKHPGKFIYHCTKCDTENQFKTNYNNEYQQHLLTKHQG